MGHDERVDACRFRLVMDFTGLLQRVLIVCHKQRSTLSGDWQRPIGFNHFYAARDSAIATIVLGGVHPGRELNCRIG